MGSAKARKSSAKAGQTRARVVGATVEELESITGKSDIEVPQPPSVGDASPRDIFLHTDFSGRFALFIANASIQLGYQVGVVNAPMNHQKLRFELCGNLYDFECEAAREFEKIAAPIMYIGAFFGTFIAGWLMSWGRRWTMRAGYGVLFLGALCGMYSLTPAQYIASRVICGISIGIFSVAPPIYISEMTPASRRGILGIYHQVGICVGVLLAVIFCTPLSYLPIEHQRPSDTPFAKYGDTIVDLFTSRDNTVLLLLGVFSCTMSVLGIGADILYFPYESPTYLASVGKVEEAAGILELIHNRNSRTPEIAAAISNNLRAGGIDLVLGYDPQFEPEKIGFFKSIFTRKGYFVSLIIGCSLGIIQQITGINAFVSCSINLLRNADLPSEWAIIMSAMMAILNLFMAFIAARIIDRFGRRPLLLASLAGQTFSLTLVPLGSFIGLPGNLPAASAILSFIVFFGVGSGPVIWVCIFEIFPADIKSIGSGIATGLLWLTSWFIVTVSTSTQDIQVIFRIFGLFSFISFVWVYLFVRETKGCSGSPYDPSSTYTLPKIPSGFMANVEAPPRDVEEGTAILGVEGSFPENVVPGSEAFFAAGESGFDVLYSDRAG